MKSFLANQRIGIVSTNKAPLTLVFQELTYEQPSESPPFDVAISYDGSMVHADPTSSTGAGHWLPRKRSGSTYNRMSQTGLTASMAQGGSAFDSTGVYLFYSTGTTVVRAAISGTQLSSSGWSITPGAARALAVSSDGKYLALGSNNNVFVYDIATQTRILSYDTGSLTEAVEFSPTGKYLISGSRSTGLNLWLNNSGTFTRITTGSITGSTGYGNWGITWHANEDMFVAGQWLNPVPGVYAYALTNPATNEFTRLADSSFDSPLVSQGTVGVCFLQTPSASDYLIAANAGSSFETKVWKRFGNTFKLVNTNFPSQQNVFNIRSATNSNQVTYIANTAPYVRVFDYFLR
jgi:WD40 repeat protein